LNSAGGKVLSLADYSGSVECSYGPNDKIGAVTGWALDFEQVVFSRQAEENHGKNETLRRKKLRLRTRTDNLDSHLAPGALRDRLHTLLIFSRRKLPTKTNLGFAPGMVLTLRTRRGRSCAILSPFAGRAARSAG
jgi:hypothetical protein